MPFSPSQIESLQQKPDHWDDYLARSWPWASQMSGFGWTSVFHDETGWCVAARVVQGSQGKPAIQELRIVHGDNMPSSMVTPTTEERPKDQRAAEKNMRALADRAFWLDDEEDWLWNNTDVSVPNAPQSGITTTVLRSLPWGDIIGWIRDQYGDHLASFDDLPWDAIGDEERDRPKGRDRGELFYAARAAEYLKLVRSGERKPVDTLAERHQYDRETAAGWLKQARARGLLESAGRGRAGGKLTDKAMQLLEGKSNG